MPVSPGLVRRLTEVVAKHAQSPPGFVIDGRGGQEKVK